MNIAAKNGSHLYIYTSPFVSAEPGIWRSGGEIVGGTDPREPLPDRLGDHERHPGGQASLCDPGLTGTVSPN